MKTRENKFEKINFISFNITRMNKYDWKIHKNKLINIFKNISG